MSACAYCGSEADTVDHVIPRAWGGSDDAANLVPACRSCNSRKGTKPASLFLLTKREQRQWLIARGWTKIGSNTFTPPEDPHTFFTLGNAIRYESFVTTDERQQRVAQANRHRLERRGLRAGDVYALGLSDGECPVGYVAELHDDGVLLHLYSWMIERFTADERWIAYQDIRQWTRAERDERDGMTVFHMDPLGDFQTQWLKVRQGTAA